MATKNCLSCGNGKLHTCGDVVGAVVRASELRTITDNVVTFNVDSREIGAMEIAADELEESFGPLHVPCNNAGIPGGETTILETDHAQWRRIFGVNFLRPINGINVFPPRMLDHGSPCRYAYCSSTQGKSVHRCRNMISAMAVPTETVGTQVMNAILTGEFYVFCDGTHT